MVGQELLSNDFQVSPSPTQGETLGRKPSRFFLREKIRCCRRISVLSLEVASANLRRENLGSGNVSEIEAPRSVSLAARRGKNCGKLASFAVCRWNLLLPRFAFGTFFFQGCAAKILDAEICEKHGRHAAFRSQRGRPKIVASLLDSRFAFGTCFRQLGPRKFCEPKF